MPMNRTSKVMNQVRRAAWAVVMGTVALPALGGDVKVGIGIRIGEPAPPPRVVVVEERPVVVYETFVVGHRRTLYDADLALRLARADEFRAYEELQTARRREAELAGGLDDTEGTIADLKQRIGDRAGDAAEIHAKVEATAALCADLSKKLGALDRRIQNAKEDMDAAKTLRDQKGFDEARERLHEDQQRAGATAEELKASETRLARLQEEEKMAATFAADRIRLRECEGRAAALAHDLEVAHDAVYNTQQRWNEARERTFV